ncbi:MAG: Ig-like domain-containing protein, partial [Gemmatimonadota bacterium]
MKRARIVVLSVLAAVVFFASCSDEQAPLAPGSEIGPSLAIVQDAATLRISTLIETLYPKPGLYRQAANRWQALQRTLDRGDLEDAQDQARAFATQAIVFVRQGLLLAPSDYPGSTYPDPTLPDTPEEAVGEMVTRLYVYSDLEASEAQEENPDYFQEVLGEEDSGVGIVDPDDVDPNDPDPEVVIITQNEWAAVVVDPTTVTLEEPSYVTVDLLDEETCSETGDLKTARGCWDINSYPEIQVEEGETMRIEICVADNETLTEEEWALLLVHEKDKDTGEITALPYVEPQNIDCTGFDPTAPPPAPSGEGVVAEALHFLGEGLSDLLLPDPVGAVLRSRPARGIGGLKTDFSEFFGAVAEAEDMAVGTGTADTWEITEPSTETLLCAETNPADCPVSAEATVEISAVASGPSGTFLHQPWDQVYFYYQPQDGSAPPTLIGGASAGGPDETVNGTRSFEWTVTLSGTGLPYGRLEIFAVGAVDTLSTYRTEFNTNVSVYAEVEPIQTISTMGAGQGFSCALRSDGKAFCWGRNYYGQLGDGTRTDSPTPVEVRGGHTFDQIFVTDYTACALTSAGSAYCWGNNRDGMLGSGQPITTEDNFSLEPVPVSGGHSFVQLDMSYSNVCGIATDGFTYCWGRNQYGELGNGVWGAEYDSNVPVPVNNSEVLNFATVSGPYRQGCALTGSGDAYCWGMERYFGNGYTGGFTVIPTPTPAVSGMRLSQIDVGTGYTCAIDGNHDTYCWGHYADVGSLGNGTDVDVWDPTLVVGGHSFEFVRTNDTNTSIGSTCALTAGGEAWCWGANHYGQLGGPSSDYCSRIEGDCALSPIAVSGGISFSAIDVGRFHTCGLDQGGTLFCWGDNQYGQLGDGTVDDSPEPSVVGPLVEAPGPGPILVTPTRPVMNLLESTLQLEAVAYDRTTGDPLPIQPTFSWTSSDPTVASVDASGLVTAWANGTAVIDVAAPSGAEGRTTIAVSLIDPVSAFHNAFVGSTTGVITLSGLITDEWLNSSTWLPLDDVDTRSIPADNIYTDGAFDRMQRARTGLEWEVSVPSSPRYPSGQMYALTGFAYLALAENWCSGVPVDDPDVGLSTTELLDEAIANFEDALTSGDIPGDYATAARVGLARTYLEAGDYTQALAQAQQVPTEFVFNYDDVSGYGNGVYEFNVVQERITLSDQEGTNGLPFRSANDPRVPWVQTESEADPEAPDLGSDWETPQFDLLKYDGPA